MPRELPEASSLPSQEQWGHCGRPGKCGQILGLAVTQLGALFLPGSLSASSGRRRAGGCRPFLWALGTKCSQIATDTKLPDDTTMQQTGL